MYEWIVDNNLTPYVAVDTCIQGVMVPEEYIKNDDIILDVSPTSTQNLIINNDALEFKTRFGGIIHNIYIPISSVMAIYAKENEQGMAFSEDEEEFDIENSSETASQKNKPKLKLVTGGIDDNTE